MFAVNNKWVLQVQNHNHCTTTIKKDHQLQHSIPFKVKISCNNWRWQLPTWVLISQLNERNKHEVTSDQRTQTSWVCI